MTEKSYFWLSPTGDGSLNPYDADAVSDFFRKLFEADRTVPNILMGYLNSLEVTSLSPLSIQIDTGAAMVDGKLYVNDEAIEYILTPPVAGTDYYCVMLRKDWNTKTVSLYIPRQNGSYPAVTQIDGTTWDVIIAQFTLTSAGVLSAITDNRRSMGANRYRSILHANPEGMAWRYKAQMGVVRWTGGASATGNVTVTFPTAFQVATPVVICSHLGSFFANIVVQPTLTNVVIYWKDVDGATHTTVDIAWIAIGVRV